MNRELIENGDICHVYNRGVEGRNIVQSAGDSERFIQSIVLFNSVEPIGSIHEIFTRKYLGGSTAKEPLVKILAYCLNPNHYHLILEQVTENGISEFMKRLNGGYTWYFNNKYDRKGVLFQGRYKSKKIQNLSYLLRVSVYVNLNDRVHELFGGSTAKLIRSSWSEYVMLNSLNRICDVSMIVSEFGDNTAQYEKFAKNQLIDMRIRKKLMRDIEY